MVRGAKRILTDAERNHAWAMQADVPYWLRQVTAARVAAAERRLAELCASS